LAEGGISVHTEDVGGQHPHVNKLVVGFIAAQDISTDRGTVGKRAGRYLENDPPGISGFVPEEVTPRRAIRCTVYAAASVTLH
jgi:hypothetical protein